MHAVTRFRVPEGAIDLHQVGPLFYYASRIPGKRSALIELDAPNVRSRRLARVRDQFVGHPTVLPVGIAFSSTRIRSMVVRGHDGEVRKWSGEGDLVDVARCGADFVASALRDDHMVIVRMDANGRVIETLADGSWTTDPACSPDGRVLFYLQQKGRLGVVRCDQAGCRRIADRQAMSLSVSPDGRHLAIVALGPRGPVVEVSGPNGDRIRELVETETACKPQWASPNTLWVSRRRGMRTVWTEVDVESGRETGKSVSGLRDCADGRPDPQAPGQPEWRVVHNLTAQLRLVGPEYLTRR
jgi:hypothetical protein